LAVALVGSRVGWQSRWLAVALVGSRVGWQSRWLAVALVGTLPFVSPQGATTFECLPGAYLSEYE
jgi:hypothetical protein